MIIAAPARTGANRPARAAPAQPVSECVVLHLGEHRCAIDAHLVQELRAYEPPTVMAGMPQFVEGVVGIRGALVPVVDLRMLLACGSAHHDGATVLVVLGLHGRTIALVADGARAGGPSAVHEVPHIDIEALLNDAGLGTARALIA